MNENPQSSPQWLPVSRAAEILGISDRAVQKRCAAGKLAARRIETPQGARWEIDANQITRTGEPSARTVDASQDANRHPNQRTIEPLGRVLTPEPANQENAFHAQDRPNQDANQRTEPREPDASQDANQANLQNDFHAHLLEENRFLRGLVEQHQRSEAELRAALRTALAAMPKAITEGASSTRNEGAISRENTPQAPTIAATGKVSQGAQKAVKREMRPLWKVILGVR